MVDTRYPYALPVGTSIAGYDIVRVLGVGGFGITYEGHNRFIKRRVAIKEFFPRGMASREGATQIVFNEQDNGIAQWALRRFEESTGALAELEHKHILQVLNYIASHGTGYMVMEHVDGETFDDWLKAKPALPSLAELRPVLEPIFDALEYVHARNILHRDIAPDNIMIAKGGRPVLIDFGAIKLIEEQTRIKTAGSYAVGKRFYSPPEQLSGNANLDARTDLYALAAVIYRALSGQPPADADHRRGEVIDGGSDVYIPISQTTAKPLSPEQASVIDRALSLRRDERPKGIAEFRTTFGWLAAGMEAPSPKSAPADVALPERIPLKVSEPLEQAHEVSQVRTPEQLHKVKGGSGIFQPLLIGAATLGIVAISLFGFGVFRSETPSVSTPPPVSTVTTPQTQNNPAPPPNNVVTAPSPLNVPAPAQKTPAEKWAPTRSITLVVPFAARGGTDIVARAIADKMREFLGQTVIIETRVGGAGAIAAGVLARAAPDGYTIGIQSSNILVWRTPDLTYNPERDFTFISLAATLPFVLAVNASVPANSVAEFIAHAQSLPGTIKYATAATGSSIHLMGEYFKARTGIDMTAVSFQNTAEIVSALAGGEAQATFVEHAALRSLVAAGKVKVLGLTAIADVNPISGIPSIAATVPGFDVGTWAGFVAPNGTPDHIVHALSQAINLALRDPDVRKKIEAAGFLAADPASPEVFSRFVDAERKKWQEIIRQANVKK